MKRCMYCGHVNEDTAENCSMCGNRLLDVSADMTAPEERLPEEAAAEPASRPADDVMPEAEAAPAAEPAVSNVAPGPSDMDVHRGDTYAAQQQYTEEAPGAYGGQDYSYQAQAGQGQMNGGQAYGYPEGQEYGASGEETADFGTPDEEYPGTAVGPLRRKARKMVKSFLFFLPVLIYTVATVAGILNAVLGTARINLTTFSNTMNGQFGSNMITDLLNTGVAWVMGQNVYVVNGAFLLRYIPAVFIMIGLWLAFFNTTNKKEINSTTGFTLIRVIEILKFIINCILLIGSIALAVVYVVAAGAAAETMSLIVGVIMLLVVILLSVFIIMFFLQLIFAIKVVRENVRTGFDRRKIPGFLIFIGFVGCLVNVAAMLPMAPDDYIGLVANGALALWWLLITLWAIIYRIVVKVK